jgi:hypothetical protein
VFLGKGSGPRAGGLRVFMQSRLGQLLQCCMSQQKQLSAPVSSVRQLMQRVQQNPAGTRHPFPVAHLVLPCCHSPPDTHPSMPTSCHTHD